MSETTSGSGARLLGAIPILLTGEIAASVAFFERLGFAARYNDGAYAILARDEVELHFSGYPGLDPRVNQSECRVNVQGIEALYYLCQEEDAVHPNGKLSTMPYGMKEFAVLDPSGICVKFAERLADEANST